MKPTPEQTRAEKQPPESSGLMPSGTTSACALMKTLGHRDRLKILCHLLDGEKSVGELVSLLRIDQPPLSQHLARMRKESLVRTRRVSQTIYYSVASLEVKRMITLLHELYCEESHHS